MPLAKKLRGPLALSLLVFAPGHHIDDSDKLAQHELTQMASSEETRARMQFISRPALDSYEQAQLKSLNKSIKTLKHGKELSYGQSFSLISSFKTYKASDLLRYLVQVQRDINNPETKLYKKLDTKTRNQISQELTPFINELIQRSEANNGKLRLKCKDLNALQNFNQLKPIEKSYLLKNFRTFVFAKQITDIELIAAND